MLIFPKWLKLQTYNSASMLPRKCWHDHWKNFGKGTWQGSRDRDNSNVQTAAMGPIPRSKERNLVQIQFESRPVLMSKPHDSLLFMVGLLYREALDRLCVRWNMYLVYIYICCFITAQICNLCITVGLPKKNIWKWHYSYFKSNKMPRYRREYRVMRL